MPGNKLHTIVTRTKSRNVHYFITHTPYMSLTLVQNSPHID